MPFSEFPKGQELVARLRREVELLEREAEAWRSSYMAMREARDLAREERDQMRRKAIEAEERAHPLLVLAAAAKPEPGAPSDSDRQAVSSDELTGGMNNENPIDPDDSNPSFGPNCQRTLKVTLTGEEWSLVRCSDWFIDFHAPDSAAEVALDKLRRQLVELSAPFADLAAPDPARAPLVETRYGKLPVGTRLKCRGDSIWHLFDANMADTWRCAEVNNDAGTRVGDMSSHEGCPAEIIPPLAHDNLGYPLYQGDLIEWRPGPDHGLTRARVLRNADEDDPGLVVDYRDDWSILSEMHTVRKVHEETPCPT